MKDPGVVLQRVAAGPADQPISGLASQAGEPVAEGRRQQASQGSAPDEDRATEISHHLLTPRASRPLGTTAASQLLAALGRERTAARPAPATAPGSPPTARFLAASAAAPLPSLPPLT